MYYCSNPGILVSQDDCFFKRRKRRKEVSLEREREREYMSMIITMAAIFITIG